MDRIEADVVVAGGGMGGILAAERARLAGSSVVLLTAVPGASIRMAGFATALDEGPGDRPEDLFDDMYTAGGFVSDPRVLAAVVDRIGHETRFFEEIGAPFVRESEGPDGPFARRQASGVTRPRAVYSMEMVGDQVLKLLLERLRSAGTPPVWILHNAFLMDLDVLDGEIMGGLAYVGTEERWVQLVAPAVVLATGGCGRLYRKSTNFRGSTGMGVAMALEAGAQLVDMEFISFEPSVAIAPERASGMELPTMAFADGALLRNADGDSFVSTMPPASKDVMSRAIMREVREGRGSPAGGVFMDLTQMDPDTARSFQQIRRLLRALEVPPTEAVVEVAPSQHYLMGGVRIDEEGSTRIPGLFAVGEASGGVHGAHRLATCGGTDVIAMGAIAGEAAARHARSRSAPSPPERSPIPEMLGDDLDEADASRLETIRDALEQGCGVLRVHDGLERTRSILDSIRRELAGSGRLRSYAGRSVLVASAIATAALTRRESRGDHFRTDHPHRDDRRWFGNLVTTLTPSGDLEVTMERIGPHPGRAG